MAQMSQTGRERHPGDVPRLALIAIAGLMAFTLAGAATARWTGLGASRVSPGVVAGSVMITFADQPNGTALVRRAEDGRVLEVLPADGGGFLRGVMKSLLRQRRLAGLELSAPFELVRRVDGRHVIIDTLTRSRMELDGFGPTNSQAVAIVYDAAAKR